MKLGILVAAAALAGSIAVGAQRAAAPAPAVDVFKTPTCGCCGKWVEHLRASGFTVKVTDLNDLSAIKAKHGIPARLQSCHTATVDGYVLEGHVPAQDVKRLLKERPQVKGVAVAGMPIGSPGMEVGSTVHPYDVMTFDGQGRAQVFASHGRK
jgi:hypothetical protein